VYDVFARSFKYSRVDITIDFRFSAKKKSRVDAQERASFEIVFDSKSEMKKKEKENEKKNAKKKMKEKKKKEKRTKTTKLSLMTKRTTSSTFESCRSLLTSNLKFKFLSSVIVELGSDTFFQSDPTRRTKLKTQP
jgi:tRNA G10  N-methylase Trm11